MTLLWGLQSPGKHRLRYGSHSSASPGFPRSVPRLDVAWYSAASRRRRRDSQGAVSADMARSGAEAPRGEHIRARGSSQQEKRPF